MGRANQGMVRGSEGGGHPAGNLIGREVNTRGRGRFAIQWDGANGLGKGAGRIAGSANQTRAPGDEEQELEENSMFYPAILGDASQYIVQDFDDFDLPPQVKTEKRTGAIKSFLADPWKFIGTSKGAFLKASYREVRKISADQHQLFEIEAGPKGDITLASVKTYASPDDLNGALKGLTAIPVHEITLFSDAGPYLRFARVAQYSDVAPGHFPKLKIPAYMVDRLPNSNTNQLIAPNMFLSPLKYPTGIPRGYQPIKGEQNGNGHALWRDFGDQTELAVWNTLNQKLTRWFGSTFGVSSGSSYKLRVGPLKAPESTYDIKIEQEDGPEFDLTESTEFNINLNVLGKMAAR